MAGGSRVLALCSRWYRAVLFFAGIALIGVIEYRETGWLGAATQFEQLFIYDLIGYANLLFIGSAMLYVGNYWSPSEGVGRWASRLASLGAVISLLALMWRWIETYYLQRPGHVPLSTLYEVMSLFIAMTVAIYLVMERVYRTRSAGAFLMLIVVAAVLFQIWLAAHERAIPGSHVRVLRSYWMHAHVLFNIVGYGAFAVAAAAGAAYLARERAERLGHQGGAAILSLPELRRADRLMHNAIMLGFPLVTLATILGALWAYHAWGRYWAWDPKETWALIVWLTYASYFYFRSVRKWSSRGMAWWSIAGFAVTVFSFLGVRVLWPGLHAIGAGS